MRRCILDRSFVAARCSLVRRGLNYVSDAGTAGTQLALEAHLAGSHALGTAGIVTEAFGRGSDEARLGEAGVLGTRSLRGLGCWVLWG